MSQLIDPAQEPRNGLDSCPSRAGEENARAEERTRSKKKFRRTLCFMSDEAPYL
jgi:hypothetical protein